MLCNNSSSPGQTFWLFGQLLLESVNLSFFVLSGGR